MGGEDVNVQSPKEKSMSEAEALLVKNGFRLESCDKQGVDFLACRPIMVQFRTRLGVYKKNVNQELYMCFPVKVVGGSPRWYLIPHDELLEIVDKRRVRPQYQNLQDTKSWRANGGYHIRKPSEYLLEALSKWRLWPSEE
jgi:hypothetical protein